LRGGISTPLPKLLEIRNVIDDICRDYFGFIPDWNKMNASDSSSIRTAAYVAPLGEIRFYVEWGDQGKRKSIDLSSSVIAKVEGQQLAEYFFEIDIKDRGSMQSVVHAHIAAVNSVEARYRISRLLDYSKISTMSYSFCIDDGSEDVSLVAIPTSEADGEEMDLLMVTIDAESAEEALLKLSTSAKSSFVREAAANAIRAFTNQPRDGVSTFSPC
jgi:hypothetical protein